MIDLRDIEIFLVLAEELHFGRTAARLHLTPGRISQSIAKQERHVGGLLFERTTRTVLLTPLGEQLHRDFSAGYRRIMAGIDAAAATTAGISGALKLGLMGPMALVLSDVLRRFQDRHPAAQIHVREVQPPDPLVPLRSGEVDLALLWLPVREPDLTVGPVLRTTEVMLMVGATHPLAGRGSVCLEDLGDHAVVGGGSIPAYMEEVLNPFHTPSGRPIARGPRVTTLHDALAAVGSGRVVAAVTSDIPAFYSWPNLVFLPVRDATPVGWALVWRTAAENRLIRAFVDLAGASPPGAAEA
ncbi:LysR family transcriptional regulator [Dactylosporangium siamense]|uniref:LysR family transcriptional regulator n=1 Tax=Dactylosporangium siamense TaxID=685454 RepID=A0A919U9K7_9ACTN|nr:LysR family transcriptional regulator [Dactylosporangium siamense]GIG43406.1 LysR family transcriptional regulator [Dactylosporangium siamense]